MSSSSDRMESRDSEHSLLSSENSEMGSDYSVESGVFMPFCAATVFVSSLVAVAVLCLTLLIALIVMLQSCQRRGTGVFKHGQISDQDDYCNLVFFHAELNKLKEDEFPTMCKKYALKYITGGQFLQDLNLTVYAAESYFNTQKPDDDGLDVILMDMDSFFLSDITYSGNLAHYWRKQVEDMKHLAHLLVQGLYMKVQSSGWPVVLFTRNSMGNNNATIESLISVGYGGWSSLIMRSDDEILMESWEYISGIRQRLRGQGFQIVSVISADIDALTGPCLGKRNFKLTNSIYYRFEQPGGLL